MQTWSATTFRVENPGTVYFTRRVGRTGRLVVLKISAEKPETWLSILSYSHRHSIISCCARALHCAQHNDPCTLVPFARLVGVLVIAILVLGRLCDMALFDKMVVGISTMLVYLDATLASNLKMFGRVLLIVLLVATAN